jgi:RNA polymerase sigma factor (sigma-70 family)
MGRPVLLPAHKRVWGTPKPLLALARDEALVAQIRAGNHAAFEVAFERHASGVLSFCRHMLGSREAAEDAVQQTFASAYSDLLRSEREVRLKPWLFKIARNRCISMLRAAREQPTDELAVETAGLHEQVQRRADLRELLGDLADLPAQQRAALVLSELADLSHQEIAEVLGVKTHKIKGLVFRARSGLIERREARDAPCEEIRERLANLRGGALRSLGLRQHLKACPGCSAYLDEVRRQRRMLALALPVVPTVGFKRGVLAAIGFSGTSAGGGSVAGGLIGSAALGKAAIVLTVAGGTGVAGGIALDSAKTPAAPADEASQSRVAPATGVPAAPVRSARAEGAPAIRERRRAKRRRKRAPAPGASTPARSGSQGKAKVKRRAYANGHTKQKSSTKSASSPAAARRARPRKRVTAPRRVRRRAHGAPALKPPATPKTIKKK